MDKHLSMKRKVLFIFTMLKRMFTLTVLRRPVKFRFHELNKRWYVDYPEYPGPHSDLEMVIGADKLCMSLAEGSSYVDVWLSLSKPQNPTKKLVLDTNGQKYGRDYVYFRSHRENIWKYKWRVWLCPVMIYTFGYYPSKIYLWKDKN